MDRRTSQIAAVVASMLLGCATSVERHAPEPLDCRSVVARVPIGGQNVELRGFADFHGHMFSQAGFGQYLFHGDAYPVVQGSADEQMKRALRACEHTSLLHPVTRAVVGELDGSHGHDGYPDFESWPNFQSHLHQQMYVDWVYRAYRHGLRLLVVVITNSEALCRLTHHRPDAPCDGSGVVSRQLNLIHSMVERIRAEEGGWLQLARHADEAEEIVADNRLALVIGVEIDTPFGCAHESDPTCRRDAYTDELNDWYERGVRQINPVHLIDNGFGGAAIYDERMNVSQHFLRGTYLGRDPAGCADPAIDYELQGRAGVPTALWLLPALQTFRGYDPRYDPSPAGQEGHCNARGLSEDGVGLVRELMARGMLIDIDHLSEKSIDEILAIAREPCRSPTGCYPLMAGHSWFRDLKFRLPEGSGIYHDETAELEEALELTTELQKSSRTLDAIGELGGVVGVMTNHGPVSRHGNAVPNDCDTSSKSLAQALLYAVDQMNGRGGVGLGTDFNGLAGQTGPRFGAFACGSREGDATLPVRARQENRLHYPFESYFGESVSCNRAGDRSFDFNEDGLAHYGLLPDLIADLEGVGLPRPALDTLFGSANAYVKMWRQAEKYRDRRD